MTKKKLESYQVYKRLIERNKKKIEEERCRDIPVVSGKVTGSLQEFPYTQQKFTVQMYEPAENDKSHKRILTWQKGISEAEQNIKEVEQFIDEMKNVKDREIFELCYIAGKKQADVAKLVGYTQGRVSQIIQKYLED